MMNYSIWVKDTDNNMILVEIFNQEDVQEVQKEFVNKGYTITNVDFMFNSIFVQMFKPEDKPVTINEGCEC